ncbi:hypothetical protein M0R45_001232 [Rubus argutus]|uniref:Uncharacterized protein n=1 Tax=Rubus argutus TaxID=59490 RepID=A0AAW1VI76_RUBAR
MHDNFGKDGWRTVHQVDYDYGRVAASSKEPATSSSTQDAISQLRSRRPISRTDVPSGISSKEDESHSKDGKADHDICSSSSDMISFEFSNGDPHVPAPGDDDQYVEYQLEDLAGFPSDVDEEERMFMEAVLLSLKDLEMRHPNPPAEEQARGIPLILQKSISSAAIKADDSRPEQQTPDTAIPSIKPASQTSTSTRDLGSAGPSTQSDAPAKVQSTSDTDMSANTTATVTVVKNPASHVMDGLMRRWDFNFFRNNHSR